MSRKGLVALDELHIEKMEMLDAELRWLRNACAHLHDAIELGKRDLAASITTSVYVMGCQLAEGKYDEFLGAMGVMTSLLEDDTGEEDDESIGGSI